MPEEFKTENLQSVQARLALAKDNWREMKVDMRELEVYISQLESRVSELSKEKGNV